MSKTEIYYLDPPLGDDISAVTSTQSVEEFFLIKLHDSTKEVGLEYSFAPFLK